MIGLLVLLFPFVLLAFVLFMERVEEPLSRTAVERDIEQFLDVANRDELNTFVSEGADSALSRFGLRRWRRNHVSTSDAASTPLRPNH